MQCTTKFPLLAPELSRTTYLDVAPTVYLETPRSDADWAPFYSEIERLYVRERRKLRYVINFMETEYGVRASPQMYKKRFAKWGFQKSCKRTATNLYPEHVHIVDRPRATPTHDHPRLIRAPRASPMELTTAVFLSSVRAWGVSFFDNILFGDTLDVSLNTLSSLRPLKSTKEIHFAFKLVIDMFRRGQGSLAGRLARRTFLLVEDMLSHEAPILLWNLLETLHHMAVQCQAQLFRILIAHLLALAEGRVPETHPLLNLLRSLQRFVAHISDTPELDHSRPAWSKVLSSLIEQAWVANAETLFARFDNRLMSLYLCMIWESCSISPSGVLFDTMTKKLRGFGLSSTWNLMSIDGSPVDDDAAHLRLMLGQLLSPPLDAVTPDDFHKLRLQSVTELRYYSQSLLDKDSPSCKGDAGPMLLSMLAGLTSASLVEESSISYSSSNSAPDTIAPISRLEAGNIACVMKTLVGLGHRGVDLTSHIFPDNVELHRSIVSLREYAEGETYPQVVEEMWQLHDALVMSGRHQKAREVEREALHRVERYIVEIPNESI